MRLEHTESIPLPGIRPGFIGYVLDVQWWGRLWLPATEDVSKIVQQLVEPNVRVLQSRLSEHWGYRASDAFIAEHGPYRIRWYAFPYQPERCASQNYRKALTYLRREMRLAAAIVEANT